MDGPRVCQTNEVSQKEKISHINAHTWNLEGYNTDEPVFKCRE